MVTVPAQCGYYCYYFYSYTYYTTRQLLLLLQQRLLLLFLQSFRWGYSWCRHWRHRWVDHYLCHCWLGVCQNLSITQPWSGLGVPSTARNLYQFKYTNKRTNEPRFRFLRHKPIRAGGESLHVSDLLFRERMFTSAYNK